MRESGTIHNAPGECSCSRTNIFSFPSRETLDDWPNVLALNKSVAKLQHILVKNAFLEVFPRNTLPLARTNQRGHWWPWWYLLEGRSCPAEVQKYSEGRIHYLRKKYSRLHIQVLYIDKKSESFQPFLAVSTDAKNLLRIWGQVSSSFMGMVTYVSNCSRGVQNNRIIIVFMRYLFIFVLGIAHRITDIDRWELWKACCCRNILGLFNQWLKSPTSKGPYM